MLWAYRYSSNDLEAQRVWIGQAGWHEKITAVRNWPGGTPPKTPAWGREYLKQYICMRIGMFQYNNVLQSATVCRKRKYVSWHSYFEQMREILTGVLFYVDEAQKIQGFTFCMSWARACKMVTNYQGFLLSKLDTLGELGFDIWWYQRAHNQTLKQIVICLDTLRLLQEWVSAQEEP